ncbi:hypothetical protein E2C01_015122 [Portunus trituberculatus]|uniref:Secreted protein n=1 Tax=Portunus trituberculatus TaxID=210409 RepID=A0A5B7DLQ4_PORTR|nr:hypothetical protein [Portunus trituberculatus]
MALDFYFTLLLLTCRSAAIIMVEPDNLALVLLALGAPVLYCNHVYTRHAHVSNTCRLCSIAVLCPWSDLLGLR